MPKTRAGKTTRRVIAPISNITDVGDVTTLANAEIVEDIRHQVQREKLARGETPASSHPKRKPRSNHSDKPNSASLSRRIALGRRHR